MAGPLGDIDQISVQRSVEGTAAQAAQKAESRESTQAQQLTSQHLLADKANKSKLNKSQTSERLNKARPKEEDFVEEVKEMAKDLEKSADPKVQKLGAFIKRLGEKADQLREKSWSNSDIQEELFKLAQESSQLDFPGDVLDRYLALNEAASRLPADSPEGRAVLSARNKLYQRPDVQRKVEAHTQTIQAQAEGREQMHELRDAEKDQKLFAQTLFKFLGLGKDGMFKLDMMLSQLGRDFAITEGPNAPERPKLQQMVKTRQMLSAMKLAGSYFA